MREIGGLLMHLLASASAFCSCGAMNKGRIDRRNEAMWGDEGLIRPLCMVALYIQGRSSRGL